MLSIGQFSKVCMVTVKTLRHYDKLGLIKPVHTDKFTNYRYYDESQLPLMLNIVRFKRYGFSLEEIKYLLSETDKSALISKLRDQASKLEAQRAETDSVIKELNRHLHEFERTGEIMSYHNNYKITLEQAEKLPIISSRQVMSIDDFCKYYGLLFERAAKERIQTNFKTMAFYHDREFDPAASDIEVGVCVINPEQADYILDAGLCATTVHYGSYSNLSEAYGAITGWIKENGYEITAAPYEIYIKTQFDKLPSDQWET
ncbi:MAG: MerR family transcriptional regulator, partial [Clostridia bacterium]